MVTLVGIRVNPTKSIFQDNNTYILSKHGRKWGPLTGQKSINV